jgi:CheY-like chemotaxis protein
MFLLVDDNREQLAMRQLILEREGFTVEIAGSATEAMGQCTGCGAIVMDLRLPSLSDGLRLIRQLHAAIPEAPIIVLAGLPEELTGRPERALVHRILRKGTGTGLLVELLRSLGS